MKRAIYNRNEWVLCICNDCGTTNYVEPHGTDAECKRCKCRTEHRNIPYEYRDPSGCWLVRRPR